MDRGDMFGGMPMVELDARASRAPWRGPSSLRFAGGGATTGAFEFNALPDDLLLGWLTAQGHRPNVLIECAAAAVDRAMRHVMTWCPLPFRYCALPGTLELPATGKGTLLLKNVAALTLAQQVALYDWLTLGAGETQVVSLSSAPLSRSVEDGEFLEGLYYRLNVIRLDAVSGTRPSPLDTWQNTAGRLA
jgi:Sigma-54 interaction domain